MLRGTLEHPKFAELQERLDLSKYEAAGLLECLWHLTARYAPDGGVGKWSDRRIARALEWERDPTELVGALLATGWLDGHPVCRLYVHDWHVHVDDAVHRSLARSVTHFANGDRPKLTRLNPGEREKLEKLFAAVEAENAAQTGTVENSTDHVRPLSASRAPNVRSAPPRPAPPQTPERAENRAPAGVAWNRITKPDLLDPRRRDQLYRLAVKKRLVANNAGERVQFHAWCIHAANEGGNPGALLADNVRARRRFASQLEEDLARSGIREMDLADLERVPAEVFALSDGLTARSAGRLGVKAAPRADEAC